jgi:hypothetical protein
MSLMFETAQTLRTGRRDLQLAELLDHMLVRIYKVIRVKFEGMNVSRTFHGLHSLLQVFLQLGQDDCCILVR